MSINSDIFKKSTVLSKTLKKMVLPETLTPLHKITTAKEDDSLYDAYKTAIQKYNIPYLCTEHNAVHRSKTRFWFRCLKHLATESIPPELQEEIKRLEEIFNKQKAKELEENLKYVKKEEFEDGEYRWSYYYITFRSKKLYKHYDTYKTKQELLSKLSNQINRAKKGEAIGLIIKGKIDEIIKRE